MTKSTGSYYTPKKLAEYIWDHTMTSAERFSQIQVLEPSCGNGIFLEVALALETDKNLNVDAIEINQAAMKQAQQALLGQDIGQIKVTFINDDFLSVDLSKKYDIVIGNPPYVSRKLLSEEQKRLCKEIHTSGGLDGKHIHNTWPAFLVKATKLLNDQGMIALVLPGELLQVSYARKIQTFLERNFRAIEILTFQDLVFPALGQDVVVVFAYKASPIQGVFHSRIRNIDSLDGDITYSRRASNSMNVRTKWSNFILTDSDLRFLSNIAQKLNKVSDYCTSTPGIVTAANDFFIVNRKTVNEFSLEAFCEPILQKSEFAEKAVSLEASSFEKLVMSDKPCYLLNLKDIEKNCLPVQVQQYIQKGIGLDIHRRYKCNRRKPWYNIPSVWIPEGVIFKRSHLYPKLLTNEAQTLFTDSAYRIQPLEGYDIRSLVFSFYNSVTLIFCELDGRFYGGGVLELTPNEFRGLPIPYKPISIAQFQVFKDIFARSESIEQVLQQNDTELLADLELDSIQIERLSRIRRELLLRRVKNKTDAGVSPAI